VSRLAMAGIRLVIGEFRSDVTKTRKDGSRGTLRIHYGDAHQSDAAVNGCGSSSTAPRTPVSFAAGGWSSSRPSSAVPARGPDQPAVTSHGVELAQGPHHQGPEEARGPHLPASLRQLETPSSALIANTWPRNAAPPTQSGVSGRSPPARTSRTTKPSTSSEASPRSMGALEVEEDLEGDLAG